MSGVKTSHCVKDTWTYLVSQVFIDLQTSEPSVKHDEGPKDDVLTHVLTLTHSSVNLACARPAATSSSEPFPARENSDSVGVEYCPSSCKAPCLQNRAMREADIGNNTRIERYDPNP